MTHEPEPKNPSEGAVGTGGGDDAAPLAATTTVAPPPEHGRAHV